MNPENSLKNSGRIPPANAWRPGQSGNVAGKPRGTRHRATMLAAALLEGELEGIVRRVISGALEGDPVCLRLAFERLVPPRKDSPVNLDLPAIVCAADAVTAMGVVASAVANGDLTPTEGSAVASIVETHRRVVETADLEARIRALEGRQDG